MSRYSTDSLRRSIQLARDDVNMKLQPHCIMDIEPIRESLLLIFDNLESVANLIDLLGLQADGTHQ